MAIKVSRERRGGIAIIAFKLYALALAVSCRGERPVPSAASNSARAARNATSTSRTVGNSVPVSSSQPAVHASAAAVCSGFADQQRALAKQWPRASSAPDVLGRCYPTRSGGAWVYPFDSIRVDPEQEQLSAHFSVAHLAPAPSATEPTRGDAPFIGSPFSGLPGAPPMPAPLNYIVNPGFYQTDLFAPTCFDFDGDGEEELAFSMQAYVSEGEAAGSTGLVFTFKNGTVSPYRAAQGLQWLRTEDVDHDGRPDLLGSYLAVPVLFHSLPDGTFSASDPVAASYARRYCPPDKRAVFLPVAIESRNDSGWNGPCARLWGATEPQLLAEIDRHCRPNRRPACLVKSVISDRVLESAESYRRDAHLPPPLLLAQASTKK